MRFVNITRLIVLSLWVNAASPAPLSAQMLADHDLSIVLFPEKAKLEGKDLIHIKHPLKDRIEFLLSRRAQVKKIRLNGRNHPFTFEQGLLSATLEQNAAQHMVDLSLEYTCRFDDPAPDRPLNTDNPDYGVSGTISARGTFILAGAGWYPKTVDARETFDLRVDGPKGTIVVTTGRQVGIINKKNRTVSRWRIDHPLEGRSLPAGPYVVERQTKAGLTAATYLLPENMALSSRYLDISLSYLKNYSDWL